MSYASVAAQNIPSPSQQPHPDQALFNTDPPTADNIADDAAKLNIVSPDFKAHPETLTSEAHIQPDADLPPSGDHKHAKHHKAKKYAHEAEQEGIYLWNLTKRHLFRPAVAGGFVGLLNIGLISGAAYCFYTKPHLRRDAKVIASTAAVTLTLASAECYAAERYSKTPAGQHEERKAKEDGALIYRCAREHILRPGVLGGLLGLLNAGILGTLGFFAYANWNKPSWDTRTVSAISIGLLTLWSGEGYVAERYRRTHH
ncbi:hypothetical protein A0H81_11885 [Grifola frondosa]|uniref:Uncharacterized protein n=1 Tax=Grifola frondosa TaxID=5627 RepID=A0A1C7LTM3_GRIFR|nr:hypothetical protein A0H81_11885 [Grifola frondosa]